MTHRSPMLARLLAASILSVFALGTAGTAAAKTHTSAKGQISLDIGDDWKVLNREGMVMARRGKVGVMVSSTPSKTLKDAVAEVSKNVAKVAGPGAKLSKAVKSTLANAEARLLVISGSGPKDKGKLAGAIYLYKTSDGIAMLMMMGPAKDYKALTAELKKILKSAKPVAPAKTDAPAEK